MNFLNKLRGLLVPSTPETQMKQIQVAVAILRIGLSLVFIWFGVTQLSNASGWVSYLPQFMQEGSVEPTFFIFLNGLTELLLGLFLLFGIFVRISALVLGLHLLGITLSVGMTAVGVRDFGLSFATLALGLFGAGACSLPGGVNRKTAMGSQFWKVAYTSFLIFLIGASVAFGSYLYTTNKDITEIGSHIDGEQSSGLAQAPVGTLLSAEFVAGHDTSSDCWLIISDKVYNVSEYVPFHPGGAKQIESRCGTDATTAFNTKGGLGEKHSSSAHNQLGKYYVGVIGETVGSSNNGIGDETTTTSNTSSQTTTQSNQNQQSTSQSSQTTADKLTASVVAAHTSQGDCWLIISGKVYNVTPYIQFHPGGSNRIISRCGTDATAVFTSEAGGGHKHSSNAQGLLSNYYIGDLNAVQTESQQQSQTNNTTNTSSNTSSQTSETTTSTQTSTGYTTSDVASHNTQSDCWLIISGKIYNVSQYIPFHPGGSSRIISRCGTDATTVFNSGGGGGHNHSSNARNLLSGYYVADLGGTTASNTNTVGTGTSGTSGISATISLSSNGVPTPSTLTISSGTTVTFAYTGGGDEVELIFSPQPPSKIKLDHEDTMATYTFNTKGTYTFHDKENEGPTGTIIVN